MWFGGKKKKTSLAARVNKLQRKVDKKKKTAMLKNKLATLQKQLRGY